MTRRKRQRDLVDMMKEHEGYRIARGYEMLENDEEFPTFEEDEELFGMELEVINDGFDDQEASKEL